jgi:putative SOS response-associated peptidase YedK
MEGHRRSGEPVKSCEMIITVANDFAGEVHDRMPVNRAIRAVVDRRGEQAAQSLRR